MDLRIVMEEMTDLDPLKRMNAKQALNIMKNADFLNKDY